jgi:hypothetical protein
MIKNNKTRITVAIELKRIELMKLNSYSKYHHLNQPEAIERLIKQRLREFHTTKEHLDEF